MNVYGFASGDPVNYADPFGLCPVCFLNLPLSKFQADVAQKVGSEAVKADIDRRAAIVGLVGVALTMSGGDEPPGGSNPLSVTVEDGVVEISGDGLTVMANMSRTGNTIHLDKAHIEGGGPGSSSISAMRKFVQKFGQQEGADVVVVQPATRTTGRQAGKTPGPYTIEVPKR